MREERVRCSHDRLSGDLDLANGRCRRWKGGEEDEMSRVDRNWRGAWICSKPWCLSGFAREALLEFFLEVDGVLAKEYTYMMFSIYRDNMHGL